jgi:acyl carrier protein
VGCGQQLGGQTIRIVDPDTSTRSDEGRIGEIWFAGESVASGYWQKKVETEATFLARTAQGDVDTCLRTGDIGFVRDGELFIAGRLKDLIIIRGRNHYPQDIEFTAEKSHPALRAGAGAAVVLEVQGDEQLLIVHEVERQQRNTDLDDVTLAIRQAVAEQHDIQPYAVVLIKLGTIPRTSSGKIQRFACRAGFLQNELATLKADVLGNSAISLDDFGILTAEIFIGTAAELHSRVREYLVWQTARLLKVDAARLMPNQSLSSLGLDSLMAIELATRIERDLKWDLPMVRILDARSLDELASLLVVASTPVGLTSESVPNVTVSSLRQAETVAVERDLALLAGSGTKAFPATSQQKRRPKSAAGVTWVTGRFKSAASSLTMKHVSQYGRLERDSQESVGGGCE